MLSPSSVLADTADEVRKMIIEAATYSRENLKGMEDSVSSKGSLEFWSSGGLMQTVPADAPVGTFESVSLTPKHIQVITLEEGKSAVAMYYSEGSMHPTGSSPVAHYLTRVTEVYVKEGGKWKVRAAHYSPVTGGGGTSQSALD